MNHVNNNSLNVANLKLVFKKYSDHLIFSSRGIFPPELCPWTPFPLLLN